VFIFRCSSLSLVVLVVVVACDMALPCCCWLFHCWLCAVVVGGQWQQSVVLGSPVPRLQKD